MRILIFFVFLIPFSLIGQAPGCPNIQVDDETVNCNNPCVDLVAEFLQTGETSTYSVSSIPYNPPYAFTGGTSAFVGTDDIFSNIIAIPFDFCFYGNTYNQLVIGANGVISFDISLANMTCNWQFSASIPSSPTIGGPYQNAIHGAYHDIDPSVTGDINYAVLGNAPCRTFVVNFSNTAHYNCNNLLTTQQIVIYETTNAIEVYINDKPTCATWNSGNALIGIQNIGATQGVFPANRNTGPWNTSQEAWRFTPDGNPNYTVEWFDNNGVSQGFGDTLLNVCTQIQDNFTAEITYTNCNGNTVTESATNTIFIDNTTGQIVSLGLLDTIKSCTSDVVINADLNLDSYIWSNGETNSSIIVNQSGNYILEATQGWCEGDDTVYVSIVNADIIESNTTICETDEITLNITEPNTIINWSTGQNSTSITVSPTTSTEFSVVISDGITSCKDSIQIDVNPLPTVNISGTNEICFGDSTLITLEMNGNPTYNVDLNGTIQAFNNNIESFMVSPTVNTTYYISSISDINCQNDTNKIHNLNVNPLPNPIIQPSSYELYSSETVELNVGNYQNISWFNFNDSSLLSQNEILIADSTLTTYVIVEDFNNCSAISENAYISFIPRVILHIPNTFTPNGDEHNELFVIQGSEIQSFSIVIVNSWGEKVFSSLEINKYWDGYFKGKLVPQGTYSYQIDIIGNDKRPFSKTGIVNVLY